MDTTISGESLCEMVQTVTSAVSQNDARPILRNLLFELDESGLVVSATDLLISVRVKYSAEFGKAIIPGKVITNAHNLLKIVKSSKIKKSPTIRLYTNENNELVVDTTKAKFNLFTENVDDYPIVSKFDEFEPYVEVQTSVLKEMLERVSFCAHTERSHFNMHGVLIQFKDGQLKVVATNGQRLAVTSTKITGINSENRELECVIPASNIPTVLGLLKTVANRSGHAKLQILNKKLNIRADTGDVCILTLSGGFVKYERGIVQNNKILSVNRKEFIDTLSSISLVKNNSSLVSLTLDNSLMSISSRERNIGSAVVTQDIQWNYDKTNLLINPDYLSESLTAMNSESVSLELGGSMSPPVLREPSPESIEYFCVFAVARA